MSEVSQIPQRGGIHMWPKRKNKSTCAEVRACLTSPGEIVHLIQFMRSAQFMCERRDENESILLWNRSPTVFPFDGRGARSLASESRCEEHENDLPVRHKYLNVKRWKIDTEQKKRSVMQFCCPCPSPSLISGVDLHLRLNWEINLMKSLLRYARLGRCLSSLQRFKYSLGDYYLLNTEDY